MELYREEQCVVRKEIIFPATQWDGYLVFSSMELSNGTGQNQNRCQPLRLNFNRNHLLPVRARKISFKSVVFTGDDLVGVTRYTY